MMKRSSLLSRKAASALLSRKASLASGMHSTQEAVVRDLQGFEDVENFFSPPQNHTQTGSKGEWTVTMTPSKLSKTEGLFTEYQLPLAGSSPKAPEAIQEDGFHEDTGWSAPGDDENEISFGSKVLPSPTSQGDKRGLVRAPRKAKIPQAILRQSCEGTKSPLMYFAENEEANRRTSKRKRIRTLQFWKNERVVYGRNEQEAGLPVVLDVVKAPKTPKQIEKRRKRRSSTRRGHGPDAAGYRLELQSDLRVSGKVRSAISTDSAEEYETLLAVSADLVKGERVPGADFCIHTIFAEEEFMSAGMLLFPKPGASKPSRNSNKHALAFQVIAGSFEVAVSRTSFIVGPGSSFFVPRNNQYAIKHVSSRGSGRLFFCHCRKQ